MEVLVSGAKRYSTEERLGIGSRAIPGEGLVIEVYVPEDRPLVEIEEAPQANTETEAPKVKFSPVAATEATGGGTKFFLTIVVGSGLGYLLMYVLMTMQF